MILNFNRCSILNLKLLLAYTIYYKSECFNFHDSKQGKEIAMNVTNAELREGEHRGDCKTGRISQIIRTAFALTIGICLPQNH